MFVLNGLKKIRVVCSVILALLFVLNLALQLPAIDKINNILVITVILISLTSITGVSRVIGYVLYGIGLGLLVYYQAPLNVWVEGITRNTYILVMFVLSPLLSIPINEGGYTQALQNFLTRYLSRKSLFYVFVSTLTFFCGTILNVAAANLVYLIGSKQTYKLDYRLLVTGISRGYSTTLIWGPTFAAVALPLELTGVTWLRFVPFALGVGIMLLVMGWLGAFLQELKENRAVHGAETVEEAPPRPETTPQDKKKLSELVFFWFVIFGLIVLISWATDMNTINIVSIIALIIPPVWLFSIRCFSAFPRSLGDYYFPQALPRMSPEIIMFSAAGFLSTAITYTGAAAWIPRALSAITVSGSTLSFIAVTIGLIYLLAICGVHAMVTVTVIGGTINPALYGVSPLIMSLILAIGWASSLPVSSSSTVNIMMAGVIQKDPVTVAIKWNYRYAVVAFLLVVAVLEMMVRLGF
jgi:hypothetical protein